MRPSRRSRARPLSGPFPYVWLDALVVRCRDDQMRMAGVCCMVAVGVNAEGRREVLGVELATSEDGAGWTSFLRGLAARGLAEVKLVISDAHAGLVEAARSVMAGAAWQRCRTHYLRNLLTKVPKSAQPLVATLVRSIFAQPDAAQVIAQHERVVAQLEERFPPPRPTWQTPAPRFSPSRASPRSTGARSGRPTRRSASTRKSAGAPTSSGPSRTARASFAWSARYLPRPTTSGPTPAAT